MRIHCLQHVSFETAGILAETFRDRGYPFLTTALYLDEPLPSIADFDVLIIMGGPMSVHDGEIYPWLPSEKALIAAAIREKKKVLGICLGAQLIAEVAGGRVYPNPQKEIGFWPVQWTEAARGMFPDLGTLFFHWHGETFDLPPGSRLLASTGASVNQAFVLSDHVLGVQFHPEVTPEIIRAMVEHEGWELVDAPFIQPAAEILGASAGQGGPRLVAGLVQFLTSNTL
jgi:GMP synthase-like glutamine amidotransferase